MRRPEPHGEVDVGRRRDPVADGSEGFVDDGEGDAADHHRVGRARGRVVEPREVRRRTDRSAGLVVDVEAAVGLAPETPGPDEPLLDRRRTEPDRGGIPGRRPTLEDPSGRGQIDVEADQVHQFEWAHREARAAQGAVDGLDRGAALGQDRERLQGERSVHAVHDEPGGVRAADRDLAPRGHEDGGASGDGWIRSRRHDDFHEGHDGRRVEEMEAEEAPRAGGRFRDGGDGQRARVRREDRGRGGRVVEGPENGPLRLEILERRLDDDLRIRGGEVVERRRVREPLEPALDPGLGRVGVEVEARGAPRQPGADAGPPALDGGRVDIVEAHMVAGLECELGDPRAHRPGADDTDDTDDTGRADRDDHRVTEARMRRWAGPGRDDRRST